MAEPFSTMRYAPDPHAYLRAMWTRKLIPLAAGSGLFGLGVGILSVGLTLQFEMLLLCPFAALLAIGAVYFKSRRNMFHPANKNAWGTRVIKFTDENFMIEASSGAESKVPWSAVQFGERRNEFVLLFLGANLPYPVPDTAFGTAEDREAFFELVEKHVRWKGGQKLRDPRLPTGTAKPPVV